MTRVFISCLGTGPYKEVEYSNLGDPTTTTLTPYIQEARLVQLSAVGPIDAYILLTPDARRVHWEIAGGLRDRLARLEAVKVHERTIPDGKVADQQWEIFEAIADVVPEGASVYFDLTHGFRTLPTIATQALTYVENACGAKLCEITYGAYEPGAKSEDGPTATWDLAEFMIVRDWSTALAQFRDYGDTRPLARLTKPLGDELAKRLRQETPKPLRQLGRCLDGFGDAIAHCRAKEVGHAADNLRRVAIASADACKPHGAFRPVAPILRRVAEALAGFPDDPGDHTDLRVQLAAIRWCGRHALHMQALTFLRESLVTAFAAAQGIPLGDRAASDKFFGALCTVFGRGEVCGVWADAALAWRDRPPAGLEGAALGDLGSLVEARNALNHAGTVGGAPDEASLAALTQRWIPFLETMTDRGTR